MIDLTRPESRYARQELITWWDQQRLADAAVFVVGAGALGNEIVKDLVLVGVGSVTVIDMDTIERSNLSRCVFFRHDDEGRFKAEVVAAAASDLNPEVSVTGIVGDVRSIGLGRLREFDLVIGGLDNREARVWINQACRKLAKPWIDGAIEGLRGVARTFLPDGPCYECTLSETDRQILSHRKSCALLDADEIAGGKVPTTATSASLVAAVQVQEAIRVLHGSGQLANQGWTFIGETLDSWITNYSEDEYCMAHDRYAALEDLPVDDPTATLAQLIARVVPLETIDAIDFESEMVLGVSCAGCGTASMVNRRLVDLVSSDVECPECAEAMAIDATMSVLADADVLDLPPEALGLVDQDVVTVRVGATRRHLCLGLHGGGPA